MDVIEVKSKRRSFDQQTEFVAQVICYVLVAVLSLFVKRMLEFRSYCRERGYHVFAEDSFKYCGLSFVCLLILKYSYFHLFQNRIDRIVSDKFEGEARVEKIKSVTKLIFDTCFYISTSVLAWFLFSEEPWFPSMIGGNGQCTSIYMNYPNWPVEKRTELEVFFMIQLGVHILSVFEMVVIKRKSERKYYEFLLHHFLAASLILFSMTCNEIVAGTIILIVHDFSDIFLAMTRAAFEIKLPKKNLLIIPLGTFTVLLWIYMRIVVFPFCLLANVYINKPTIHDDWYMIYYPYMYLLLMAFVLFGMHIYWTFFILKSVFKSLGKGDAINEHEKPATKLK